MAKFVTKEITSEDHAATRRASKAKRNAAARAAAHSRKASGGTAGTNIMAEIYADQAKQRRQDAEQRNIAREVKAYAARQAQANLAHGSAAITSLKKDSIALKVALFMIEEFPNAEPYMRGDIKVSRTTAAYEIALTRLSDMEMSREKAVKMGVSSARAALQGAYVKMGTSVNA